MTRIQGISLGRRIQVTFPGLSEKMTFLATAVYLQFCKSRTVPSRLKILNFQGARGSEKKKKKTAGPRKKKKKN